MPAPREGGAAVTLPLFAADASSAPLVKSARRQRGGQPVLARRASQRELAGEAYDAPACGAYDAPAPPRRWRDDRHTGRRALLPRRHRLR
jgi:hypothetical protein